MRDIELIRQAVEQKYDELLTDFNKILERHSLLGLEVIGVKLGIKSDQVKTEKVAILNEFGQVLEEIDLKELYVSSFTLAKATGREGACVITVTGSGITIVCNG